MKKILCILTFFIFQCSYTFAALQAQLSFEPKVSIIKGQVSSESIAIVTKQNNYLTKYDVELEKFQNIIMDFNVVSKNGYVNEYKLRTDFFNNFCKLSSDVSDNSGENIIGVKLFLDGIDFTPTTIEPKPISRKYAMTPNWHRMDLSFPKQLQTTKDRLCYGILRITAVSSGI